MRSIAIGLSGGVDSAVAAAALIADGWKVHGVFLKMHNAATEEKEAEKVAAALSIPFTVWDMRTQFRDIVIQDFIDCYTSGKTPNPCAICNPQVKFKGLLQAADALGCSMIASGHYADVRPSSDGRYVLYRMPHQKKDQSYTLYRLPQTILSRLIFPLSRYSDKADVREMAAQLHLPVANKPDSQETCFIPPPLSPAQYIREVTGRPFCPGNFVSSDGEVLGQHTDITNYTVGQRRGLGISAQSRLFVQAIHPQTNTVVLGPDEQLWTDTINLENVVLNTGEVTDTFHCSAKIRYNDTDTPAHLHILANGFAKLKFLAPKRAAAPGQSAVFYQNDAILGGGIIL